MPLDWLVGGAAICLADQEVYHLLKYAQCSGVQGLWFQQFFQLGDFLFWNTACRSGAVVLGYIMNRTEKASEWKATQ